MDVQNIIKFGLVLGLATQLANAQLPPELPPSGEQNNPLPRIVVIEGSDGSPAAFEQDGGDSGFRLRGFQWAKSTLTYTANGVQASTGSCLLTYCYDQNEILGYLDDIEAMGFNSIHLIVDAGGPFFYDQAGQEPEFGWAGGFYSPTTGADPTYMARLADTIIEANKRGIYTSIEMKIAPVTLAYMSSVNPGLVDVSPSNAGYLHPGMLAAELIAVNTFMSDLVSRLGEFKSAVVAYTIENEVELHADQAPFDNLGDGFRIVPASQAIVANPGSESGSWDLNDMAQRQEYVRANMDSAITQICGAIKSHDPEALCAFEVPTKFYPGRTEASNRLVISDGFDHFTPDYDILAATNLDIIMLTDSTQGPNHPNAQFRLDAKLAALGYDPTVHASNQIWLMSEPYVMFGTQSVYGFASWTAPNNFANFANQNIEDYVTEYFNHVQGLGIDSFFWTAQFGMGEAVEGDPVTGLNCAASTCMPYWDIYTDRGQYDKNGNNRLVELLQSF